jgi:hypothetical protein
VAVLPREDVLVRLIALLGVEERDVEAAVRFQLDGMHPFAEEDVVADWQRLGDAASFLVTIAAREVLNKYVALFSEAGVKLAGLTAPAAVYRNAVRVLAQPPAEGFVFATSAGEGWELYGESPAKPVYSAVFDAPPEAAAGPAIRELRLDPETLLRDPLSLLTPAQGERTPVSYAAALNCATLHLDAPANLLPAEMRAGRSRWRYAPTAVLALLLGGLGLTLALQGGYFEKQYLDQVQGEVKKLQPQALKVKAADDEVQLMLSKIQTLDEFRQRSKQDLDVVLELTNLVPATGFASGLQVQREQVIIGGEADQAEGLLKLFDGSPLFENSEFTMPLTRIGSNLEQFRIKTARTKGGRR